MRRKKFHPLEIEYELEAGKVKKKKKGLQLKKPSVPTKLMNFRLRCSI